MADIISGLKDRFLEKSWLVRIILINVAVFLAAYAAELVVSLSGGGVDVWKLLMMPGSLRELSLEPWTAVSYMFTHFDPLHLLANMLWLYCFGVIFLDLYAGRSLLAAYVAGGLAGAAAYFAAGSVAPLHWLVGASAAVLSVGAATVLRAPNYRINLFIFGMVKIKWVALAFVVFSMFSTGAAAVGTHAAHVGGIVAGCVIALNARYGFFRRRVSRRRGVVLPPLHKRPVAAGTPADVERRLDWLLDRIRTSGYGSLTAAERQELNELSRRIKR